MIEIQPASSLPQHDFVAALNAVTGIDLLHGFQQPITSSEEGGDLVIHDLLVKDYPIILRVSPIVSPASRSAFQVRRMLIGGIEVKSRLKWFRPHPADLFIILCTMRSVISSNFRQ